MSVRRVFVEKREGMDIEARQLLDELRVNLRISGLERVRILNRYDVEGLDDDEFRRAVTLVFSEPNVDIVHESDYVIPSSSRVLAVEYLPGQYDQRADSAAQCIQIITQKERPDVRCARIYVLTGDISDDDMNEIRRYCINAVESREASLEMPATLAVDVNIPTSVATIEHFTEMTDESIAELRKQMGLAMSFEDLLFCRQYFRDTEKRDPTVTEIRVIDTYWSDHCRHTTFNTILDIQSFEGDNAEPVRNAYAQYLAARETLGRQNKPITLMDMACLGARYLKHTGDLDNLDESEEVNACSIRIKAHIDGKPEDYLIMFKNETHNHPTEIEPFGGAATCLGGAIRDPLSGRSYVYQAMRVTGSADPTVPVSETIKGKLPQSKITRSAASGYSSYGNQIGLATGQVSEVYHPGYMAKRMEIGAVIAAAPSANVVRERPQEGDVIILLGGRTGRDGIGGATGSSKEHTVESVMTCGSEVQKGNPPTERKIQRLFRNAEVSTMIKRCNDFGAGGVCVAIGELAPSLDIELDLVPRKYEGLDGTEIAISESQERMAVVVNKCDADKFIALAAKENLEAVCVANVTDTGRMRMIWNGKCIADITREFLDTNGVEQHAVAIVDTNNKEFSGTCTDAGAVSDKCSDGNISSRWISTLSDLNCCSQKGLAERFDSTIGANTVFMPFGGKYQLTPMDGMVAKIPLLKGDTVTGTIMTYGFDPYASERNPFIGAINAVIESLARLTAIGGDFEKSSLTFQEYFEKLGRDPKRWGKPVAALLGAFAAQLGMRTAAIGGKDSMSGTFESLNVPPTLVSFAVAPCDVTTLISAEFKKAGNEVFILRIPYDKDGLPVFDKVRDIYSTFRRCIEAGLIVSAKAVSAGGVCRAVSEMSFGNAIGVSFGDIDDIDVFERLCGAIVFEASAENVASAKAIDLYESLGAYVTRLGELTECSDIQICGATIKADDMLNAWRGKLDRVFPEIATSKAVYDTKVEPKDVPLFKCDKRYAPKISVAKPRVFIPVFPGTNCEYDSAKAFERAGADVKTLVFRNITASDIEETVEAMRRSIDEAQIVMLPGGFSGGDEPEGSGKFIAAALRSPAVKQAIDELLNKRDGLMLGICNGFQALIKLGLVPHGEIRNIADYDPTLTFNTIGRHISRMVYTRVVSNKSPWLSGVSAGDIHAVAISHGEGRFTADDATVRTLLANNQIATQYVDEHGNPTMDAFWNPNGSLLAIEGITSPDGRILGKMAHSERIGANVAVNVPYNKDQRIFESGVAYFG